MHHTHQPKCTSSVRTRPHYPTVVLQVNIFYHDSVPGLLTCQQNNDAVTKILNKLLEYKTMIHKDTSGNVSADSGMISAMTGGGNNKGFWPWNFGS